MAEDYVINGESIVKIKFSPHSSKAGLQTLGATEGPIIVTPRFRHHDIVTDKTGGELPSEIMWLLSDARIRIPLIYYDGTVLDAAIVEAGAGSNTTAIVLAGSLLGNGKELGQNGNYFVSLNIANGDSTRGKPFRFRASYLAETPVEWPLGTKRSIVTVVFRAISYSSLSSNGGETDPNPVFDHTLDT